MIKTNRPSKSQSILSSSLIKCFIVLFVGCVAIYNIFYIFQRRANISLTLTSDISHTLNSVQVSIEGLDEPELHIVFSTDCTYFQDWQSIVLFHSARTVKQRGKITRIASGCTADEAKQLKDLYDMLFPDNQYYIHITPNYKRVKRRRWQTYDFYNKPFGNLIISLMISMFISISLKLSYHLNAYRHAALARTCRPSYHKRHHNRPYRPGHGLPPHP